MGLTSCFKRNIQKNVLILEQMKERKEKKENPTKQFPTFMSLFHLPLIVSQGYLVVVQYLIYVLHTAA